MHISFRLYGLNLMLYKNATKKKETKNQKITTFVPLLYQFTTEATQLCIQPTEIHALAFCFLVSHSKSSIKNNENLQAIKKT